MSLTEAIALGIPLQQASAEALRMWFTLSLRLGARPKDADANLRILEEVIQRIEGEYYTIDDDCEELLRLQTTRNAQQEIMGRYRLQLSRLFGQLRRDPEFVAAERQVQVLGPIMEETDQEIRQWKRDHQHLLLLRAALIRGIEMAEETLRDLELSVEGEEFPRLIDLQRRILQLRTYLPD